MEFIPGGPERYDHQKRGLRKMIETGGVCALLFDPGTGKTAVTLDFMSILALKARPNEDGVKEVRVLVVAPLAATDTWVLQAPTWVSPQVNVWAEVLGGSIKERAAALAARGGKPFRSKAKPRGKYHPRALHHKKSWAWQARVEGRERPITSSEGPDGLGSEKPRLVIVSTNLDTFASRRAVGSRTMADIMLEAVKRFDPAMIVVDESHKIKSDGSNVSRLLARIGATVKHRAILTGTVMPQGPKDVYGQWRFLEPFAFGDIQPDGSHAQMTVKGFENRYVVMGGYMGKEVKGYQNLDLMQAVMRKNSIVARKRDVLKDLPPRLPDNIVTVHLSPAEKNAYAEMKKDLETTLLGGVQASASNRLASMMRLRQITSGHLPADDGRVHEIGDAKARTIDSIVNDTLAGEDRVLVFTYFKHELDQLKAKLARKGTEILVIDGETPGEERLRIRRRFGSKMPQRMILVAQVKTLSLSVNELVTACNVVFGTLSQQRDDIVQGIDRLDRIGQERPVSVWFAIAPGTVDEVIYNTHRKRGDLEAAMLAHISGQSALNGVPSVTESDEPVQEALA